METPSAVGYGETHAMRTRSTMRWVHCHTAQIAYPLATATVGLLGVWLLLATSGASAHPWRMTAPPPRSDTSTLLVKFRTAQAATGVVAHEGDHIVGVTAGGARIVRISGGRSVAERVAAYRARADVVYAEPNWIRSIDLAPPNDPSFGSQWALAKIGAVAGWTVFPGAYGTSGGPEIAVVDTGVDLAHPDLAANLDTANDANCVSGSCSAAVSVQDDNGHGTHVTGIAAAVTNNATGIAGVSLASRAFGVKVLNSAGSGTDAAVASGILWAAAHGARVINLSLGGGGSFPTTLCNAVSSAISQGALVVAAAGNSGSSAASYPAACPGAVGVAATDANDNTPSFSNFGSPNVFLSAPGVSIYSTYWQSGSTYATLSGTSMASPHVAGLAALLFGEQPSRTPVNVKQTLAQTAAKVGSGSYGADPYGTCGGCTWESHYGYGRIDVLAALSQLPPPATIASFSPAVAPTGGSVTLTGTSFVGVSSVTLGFVPASFTVDSPTQITATVPPGVSYGRWRATTPSGTAVDQVVFTATPPVISSFSPASGSTGSTVTIAGSGFLNVSSVMLGNVPASFTVDSTTHITATVPAGVAYGRWQVTTPLWAAANPVIYSVTSGAAPGLTFAPAVAPTGGTVTLTGNGFTGVTSVSLGFVATLFTVDSPTQITATVPSGVAYGRWRVTTGAGTLLNELVFTVTPPDITSFAPGTGATGSAVTITGSGFLNVSSVTLGNVSATFTVNSPTQITATVPAGVAYGRWRVITPLWTAADPIVFSVTG